ncbi:peptidase M1-like protein [Scopulibacillus darangshiensis]|uniref:Peptidase M1-like protein n=1 Tax=Scopulibacillus darangshiensis TaxID=442528 RepID=A0A4R2NIE4_9BACL|nr:M1 family metallopeptidase [Scopulibacillus darangshiensis]TCP20965.1 peptidase M1-like protein [Scopulibacillus darangshiensis]
MSVKKLIRHACQTLAGGVLAFTIAIPQAAANDNPHGAYKPGHFPKLEEIHTPKNVKHPSNGKRVLGPGHPKYTMNVTYNSKNHTISGHMTVAFNNNLHKNLNRLYFNLWGNASVFEENGGGMTVSHVKINGKKAAYIVNDTKLKISGLSLKANKKVTVGMDFNVSLPHQQDRFGWNKTTVSLGNWFPILGVYDEEGWNLDPYYAYGESFYSLTGDFDVTLTTDKDQVIAASGTEVGKAKIMSSQAVHHYKAHNVRDFAMEMDPTYHVKSTTVNKTKINVYYTDEQAKYADAMLESGHDSIALFSKKFGKYPWPELDVVSMEGWFGGMEYPQLVMISLPGERSQNWVKSVTAHEIGHQWFYGIIGDNEYDEPWLDESFADFSAALYDGELNQLTTPAPQQDYFHLSSPVSTFTAHADEGGINAYYNTIYGYGSRTVNDLRLKLGDQQFYKSMQTYFKKKKFGVSTTADFIKIMEDTSGKDLSAFFKNHRVFVSDQQ